MTYNGIFPISDLNTETVRRRNSYHHHKTGRVGYHTIPVKDCQYPKKPRQKNCLTQLTDDFQIVCLNVERFIVNRDGGVLVKVAGY